MVALQIHPAAAEYPLIEGEEFEEFVENVRKHGQLIPIVVHADVLLDGRNRLRACERLSLEPKTTPWDGRGGSPVAFIASVNDRRRHMTPGQRAALAVRLEPHFAEEAKRAQADGRKSGGRGRKKLGDGSVTKFPEAKTRALAAKATGASPPRVSEMKAVEKKAPEVFKAVQHGSLNIEQAKALADAPVPVQEEVLEQARTGKAPSARKIRDKTNPPAPDVAPQATAPPEEWEWDEGEEICRLYDFISKLVDQWRGTSLTPVIRVLRDLALRFEHRSGSTT